MLHMAKTIAAITVYTVLCNVYTIPGLQESDSSCSQSCVTLQGTAPLHTAARQTQIELAQSLLSTVNNHIFSITEPQKSYETLHIVHHY